MRADKGQPRTLTAPQQKWILEQAQAHLAVPVKVLYRRWREQDPQLPSLNSLYRFLREHELHTKARRAQLRQPLGGATKCFEAPFVNDLWMTDFSPGPYLHPAEGGQAVPTFLCVILDDHSRLIVYAAYFLRADTQAFLQTLKEALRRRGLPAKLYTDQSGPFANDHTRVVCANLGIRLLHAKPYHAWSKGKVERVIFTLQQDFEAGLRLPGQGAGSLVELNTKFSLWLQSVYHIVLDEAQSFGYGSLEEVRLLLGLNLADPPAFGLVLIGDEYLLGTLRLRQHRSLFSRIACHLSLGPWTAPMVNQYVQQSLAAAGITRQAIEPAALNRLTSASSGPCNACGKSRPHSAKTSRVPGAIISAPRLGGTSTAISPGLAAVLTTKNGRPSRSLIQ